MIYVFDLDGTLCSDMAGDYAKCEPLIARVRRVRDLHADGHTIIVSTARNAAWREFTREQLERWRVPYHALHVGSKPYGHLYIDDKAQNAEAFFGGV